MDWNSATRAGGLAGPGAAASFGVLGLLEGEASRAVRASWERARQTPRRDSSRPSAKRLRTSCKEERKRVRKVQIDGVKC